MPENKQPGFMEPPGTPTFLGLSGEEVHAIWYGILDTFGRFHEGELTPGEVERFKKERHYFWAGKVLGSGFRALCAAGVIYLTTWNLYGAVISVLVLVTGDQALGTSTGKRGG